MNKIKYLFLLISINILTANINLAQDKWYAQTSLQMIGSDIQNHNSFYFYNGIRYQSQNYILGLSFPIVLIGNNSLTQSNMSGSNMNSMIIGLGDLYLNSSFQIVNEDKIIPTVSLDGYIKFPTSTAKLEIGTGKFDAQIALGLRKFANNISLFAQFGYLFLGKTNADEITNPLTVSLGVGYTFGFGEHSILLAYDSYSQIIRNVASPKQLAFGYNYLIKPGLYFTAIISNGLNTSTSNYTISAGLNINL